jgi:hypothetical protein
MSNAALALRTIVSPNTSQTDDTQHLAGRIDANAPD